MGKSAGGIAPFMGQGKEPPKENPVKVGGPPPNVHSHSIVPKRKITPRKSGGKRVL